MRFMVKQVDSGYWKANMSKDSHVVAFGEYRPPDIDRSDFVIIAIDQLDKYSGYITCKEMDSKSLYWQFGGPMPNYRGTIHVINILHSAMHWCRERYSRINTKVESTNLAMIKMHMKVGFLITGSTIFDGKVFLEMAQEFKKL